MWEIDREHEATIDQSRERPGADQLPDQTVLVLR